jgi:hypothetical protein
MLIRAWGRDAGTVGADGWDSLYVKAIEAARPARLTAHLVRAQLGGVAHDLAQAQPGLTQTAISMRSSWTIACWSCGPLTDPVAGRTRLDAVAVGLITARPVRRRGPGHTDFAGRGAHAPPPSRNSMNR